MATRTPAHIEPDINAHVAKAVGSLVACALANGRFRVTLPIIMPSGSMVEISVWPEPGNLFMVTDEGAALFDLAGHDPAHRTFTVVAKDRAARHGADFDGMAFRYLRVGPSQLRAAIASIANLTAEVAHEVAARSLKVRADTVKDQLFARIDEAFKGRNVTHNADIIGASTATYQFDALVDVDGRRVAFDAFTDDPASIAATYTKLSDVKRLESGPSLIGVTPDPDRVGPKLTLISSVAKVISVKAAPETFIRAAKAA